MAFSVLVFGVLLRAFSSRHTDKLLWEVGYARNALLLGVVVISMGLQLALLAVPWTRGIFQLVPLDAHHVLVALERKQQGDVDVDAAKGELLDRDDAGVCGRDLDQKVRDLELLPEPHGLLDRPLGV